MLIGIAGPSGAGKSELARALTVHLGETALISLDSYYLPLDTLSFEERCKRNFDHPDSIDWPLLLDHVRKLHHGEAIDEPVYRFDIHSRAPESRPVKPAPFTIFEGLFTLHDPEIRGLLDARVFVDAPDAICLERRMARDTVQRGRTRESVLDQYARTVRPMAERYVRPTQVQADLIVSGLEPLVSSVAAVRQLLRNAVRLHHPVQKHPENAQ